jgi:hypothetical protein
MYRPISHPFACRVSLFVELVGDALTERTYDAELAGIRYHLGAKAYGLTISVAGYSEKIDVLLDTVLKEMTSFVVDPERFAVQKEEVRASLHVGAAPKLRVHTAPPRVGKRPLRTTILPRRIQDSADCAGPVVGGTRETE